MGACVVRSDSVRPTVQSNESVRVVSRGVWCGMLLHACAAKKPSADALAWQTAAEHRL